MKKSNLQALAKLSRDLERIEEAKAAYKAYQEQCKAVHPTADELDAIWESREEECKPSATSDSDRAILMRNGLV